MATTGPPREYRSPSQRRAVTGGVTVCDVMVIGRGPAGGAARLVYSAPFRARGRPPNFYSQGTAALYRAPLVEERRLRRWLADVRAEVPLRISERHAEVERDVP